MIEAVCKAAAELFAERGPAAVSSRDIAARAGVNYGLIHRHFGSRQELQRQVMTETRDHLAVIEFPFDAEFTVIEFALVRLLRFVEHKMQEDATSLRMVEHGVPLSELADVKVQIVVPRATLRIGNLHPRPDVAAVAANIHGEEVQAIDVFR